jgi:hypothetical protein
MLDREPLKVILLHQRCEAIVLRQAQAVTVLQFVAIF